MISCLILNFNSKEMTKRLVEKLSRYEILEYIVVVDNDSSDGSQKELPELSYDNFHFIQSENNFGYSAGNNIGLRWLKENSNSKYVLVSNPDVCFEESYLLKLVDTFSNNNKLALISGVMLNDNGSIFKRQIWEIPSLWEDVISNLFVFNRLLDKGRKILSLSQKNLVVTGVPAGAATCVNLPVVSKLGYYDEKVFLFYEENILATKLKRAGYSTGILTSATYTHAHSKIIDNSMKQSNKYKIYLESQYYFHRTYTNLNSLQSRMLKLSQLFSKWLFKLKIKIKP